MKRIFAFALLLTIPVKGQQKPGFELHKVIHPAPTAAAIGQYGNTPVGLYTGTANVCIPIYTIQQNDVSLPISLSYATGGVKLAEYAPWTGLGWTLNAGGIITRTSYGKPDEWGYLAETSAVPTLPTPKQLEDADDGLVDYQPDFYTFNFAGYSGRFFIDKNKKVIVCPHQNIKIEPLLIEDVGMSSPFFDIVPQFTQWRITTDDGTIYEFKDYEKTTRHSYNPFESYNIDTPEPGKGMGSISAWYLTKIKSATGNELNFTYTDYSLKYDLPGGEQYFYLYDAGLAIMHTPPRRDQQSVARYNTRNKRLSKITFRSGEVEFLAGAPRCDLVGDMMLTAIQVKDKTGSIVHQFNCTYDYLTPSGLSPASAVSCADMTNLLSTTTNTANRSYRLVLSKVTEVNGALTGKKYQLDYYTHPALPDRNHRGVDHWGYANGNNPSSTTFPFLTLNQQLSNPDNYFIFGREPSLMHSLSGVLRKITYPTGGSTAFEYEQNDAYVGYGDLPPATVRQEYSMAIHYDLYNNLEYRSFINNDGLKTYYRDFNIDNADGMLIKLEVKGFARQPISPNGMRWDIVDLANNTRIITMNEIDRSGQSTVNTSFGTVDYNYQKKLPPGNYRITFQPDEYFVDNMNYANTYRQVPSFSISGWLALVETGKGHITRSIGGLRLKSVTDTDSTTQKSLIKKYTYLDAAGRSSGKIVNVARYVYPYEEITLIDVSGPTQNPSYIQTLLKYMVIGTEPNFPLYTTQGGNVGYAAVQVYESSTANEVNGKTEYLYSNPENYPDVFGDEATYIVRPPYPPADSRDWLRGQLISQTDYKKEYGAFIPVRKIENTYGSTIFTGRIAGLAVQTTKRLIVGGQTKGRTIIYDQYHFESGYQLLRSTRETLYSSTGNFQSIRNYEYAAAPGHLYPTNIKYQNSQGNWRETTYKYPQDYSSLTATDDVTKGVGNLKHQFVVAQPVETTEYISDGTGANRKMIASRFITYHPTLPLPVEISEIEASIPFTGFAPSYVSSGAVVRSALYKPRIQFTRYGLYGTLLEQKKSNDKTETFIWGYNNSYPVAQVSGSNYPIVLSLLTPAILQQPPNETVLMYELNKLHTGFAKGIQQVHTYTYKPLVGLASHQTPARQLTRYEYDGFGRLRLIRDHANRITQLFDYQYNSIVP